MAGTTIRILGQTEFTQPGLNSASSATVVVRRGIDTSRWIYGQLTARLHPTPTWGAGTKFDVQWQPDGHTADDPNENWAQAGTYPTTLLTFTSGTDTAPIVKVANMTGVPPGLIMVMLKFTQGGQSGATFTTSVSLDLTLRE